MSVLNTTSEELDHLEGIARDSWYAKGPSSAMVRYSFEVFSRHIRGESILEMGPAEGIMTEHLSRLGKRLVLVEGAESFCQDLKQRFPQAEVVNSLFENFETDERFDNILLGHVLEHVEDPVAILRSVKDLLAEGGRLISAVPNARSIHRQAAVDMGLLAFEEAMNDLDRHHGHRRVFNPETFRKVFLEAGLVINVFGGYWLKPVSNSQIEASWTLEMLHTFMRLGERYPDIAAEIYIVASLERS
jgi:2-polyprenyl-3-methyl-5-hydroxy-6-metoxy-1,4-benzoquinol methylase